jgi:predicted nuclease of predicted toxin-antitoxin system
MRQAQVYFDEDVPAPLADLLRRAGYTVRLPRDIGTLSEPDPVHLQTCASQGWVLVTRDRSDFRRLHWLWMTFHYWGIMSQPHSGILSISHFSPGRLELWATAILEKLQEQPSLPGSMYTWLLPQPGQSFDPRWVREPVAFMSGTSERPGSPPTLNP